MSMSSAPGDGSASAIFKKPIPSHNPLKRNTACHQCRRRKLKCDAQRPCSTCLRSHAYAISRAPPGAEFPPHPECTFDEVEHDTPAPKTKYEKLEGRIAELEGLLREMGTTVHPSHGNSEGTSRATSVRSSPEADTARKPSPGTSLGTYSPSIGSPYHTPSPPRATHELSGVTPISSTLLRSPTEVSASPPDIFSPASKIELLTSADSNNYEIFPMQWPPGLPGPGVTRHLVQAFFAFYMYAGRLFHGPTFMSTLDLHPTDPRFPSPCVLHAMCAIGSLYTAEIAPTPIHTDGIFPYEIFAGRWRRVQARPDSFAEQQVKLAKICLEDLLDTGTDLVEVVQTMILLTSFYKCQGRWSEAYLSASLALNCSVPCGFTVRPPFASASISHPLSLLRSSKVLAPARCTMEDELRINIFWIAYSLERQQVSGNSFCSLLDDYDIYQLLPVKGEKFESGGVVRMEERQWCHDRNVLLNHPKNGTDSFTLFVKSMLLLSRVKRFNIRYRGRFHAGDPDMASPNGLFYGSLEDLDPRDTQAFCEVDRLVSAFYGSFPSHLRNPIQDETVDTYLFTACCAAHHAVILLHEPFASLESPTCPSSSKVLGAARAIMNLLYGVASTSFDVSLLDYLAYLTWFTAGRILIRYLKISLEMNRMDIATALQGEISFVHTMLSKAGERMPVAYRYKKILVDALVQLCGVQFLDTDSQIKATYVNPTQASFLEPMPGLFTPTTAAQQMNANNYDFAQFTMPTV